MIILKKTDEADIKEIVDHIRDADRKDIWDLSLSAPEKTLDMVVNTGGIILTILFDKVPVGLFGIRRKSLLSDTGIIWFLSTEQLLKDKRLFVRGSKIFVNKVIKDIRLSCEYKRLENYVRAENKTSIRWIEKLGFKIAEDVTSVTGARFKRYYMEIM